MEVNIHYAKTNLSQLLLKAESGEEVVIARAGKPVVRLVPVQSQTQTKKRKAGALKDILKISPDFFDPKLDEEIAEWFYENPLPIDSADLETLKHKVSAKIRKRRKQKK
jgi:prevent-host-death family protein